MIFCAEEPQKNEERRKGRTRENASWLSKYLDIPFRGTGFVRRRRTERDVAKADVGPNTPWSIGSHSTLNRLTLHVESADTPRYVGRQNTLNFSALHFDFGITSVWTSCKASEKASSRPSRKEDFSRKFSSFIQRRRRGESFGRNKEAGRKEKNESEKIFTRHDFCVHFCCLSHFLASCQKLTLTEEKTDIFIHKSLHIVNNCCKFAVEKETAGKCFMRNKVLGLLSIDWRLGFYIISKAPEVCP